MNPLTSLRRRLATMAAAIGETRGQVIEARREIGELRRELTRITDVLRLIYEDEPGQRARLRELRASDSYALAYEQPDPLVSVVIATYDNHALLRERAIPSVLAQDYPHWEIIVVGDAAPAAAAEAVASFADSRIRYVNLNRRGPYPPDGIALWHVAGIPPYNHAVQLARGHWIAPLADDDAFRPDHISALLGLARRERHEMTYGRFLVHLRDGEPHELGVFPPQHGAFGMQMCMFHSALSIFEPELAHALFELPGDWGWVQRLMRTGVRIGMVDGVVTDYYPSWSWTPRPSQAP